MDTLPDMTLDIIINKTKKILGANYREQARDEDIKDICTMIIREAAQWTNRYKDSQIQDVMNECWPVIVKCSCIAYLNRGAEGLGSQTELGQQNIYTDWVELMHKQITNRRHVI